MTGAAVDGARDLIDVALDIYSGDVDAVKTLRDLRIRLDEPLRVAFAGMVKAGKSTLLNAVLGERIAPTDAGECTRLVTWYRYSRTPRVTIVGTDGTRTSLPVKRVDGRLEIPVAPEGADLVDRVEVEWPAPGLRDLTIIDTPGIGSLSTEISARSSRFLVPDGRESDADALIYLVRSLHAIDLEFLQTFHDHADAAAETVSTIAVLSRADEIGAGRLDALLSARGVAERHRRDDDLRGLSLGIVPIAGLLAQTARTLREAEYEALAALAALGRRERERLLVSVDRFADADLPGVSRKRRLALLDRFGLFGIRLSTALLRGDAMADSTALAAELARRSGLHELERGIDLMLRPRAGELKTRSSLLTIERLLRERPSGRSSELESSVERLRLRSHPLRELRLLAIARTTGLPLEKTLRAEAELLLGGRGAEPARRLGAAADTDDENLRELASTAVAKWRTLAADPFISRPERDTCLAVLRSCEAVWREVMPDQPAWRGASSSRRNHAVADGSSATRVAAPASTN